MQEKKSESIDEFLARMSDSLEVFESTPVQELTEIEKWVLEYEQLDDETIAVKTSLIDVFLRQYYYGKGLSDEINKVEVPRMRATFSTWRNIRTLSYKRMPEEKHQKLARITEELEYKDVAIFAFRTAKEYKEKVDTLLIGTDPARSARVNYQAFKIIENTAIEAQRIEDEMHTSH